MGALTSGQNFPFLEINEKGSNPRPNLGGLLNIPTSLPRGQTNLRPELAFSTAPDNLCGSKMANYMSE